MQTHALGLDFGTESVRALVVACEGGEEAAVAVSAYPHGVITDALPGSEEPLPPDSALQHAADYRQSALEVIREVLGHVPADSICGIGVDFTACTMLPIRRDGTPLMELPAHASEPHAWVKLWKHRAAHRQAERVADLARERAEGFLQYYSGAVSPEWMLPKCWEILEESPDVYHAAELFVDAGDWIVHEMTGRFVRNACAAGYKGLWNAELGFPSEDFLTALDAKLANLNGKWLQNIACAGQRAGGIRASFAERSGLREGTPVSAATIDAHSGVPGMGVTGEGVLSIIMGTSSCHMLLSRDLHLFDGYAGVVRDGIVPGFYGYESGQAAVGDLFGWFARRFLPDEGEAGFRRLSQEASAVAPGRSGLLALDWWGGNRSVLMDSSLTGMVLGWTLGTRPAEVYRALIEGSAFGTRTIVESYTSAGIRVEKLVVCGGLVQDPLILQIYADVTGLPVEVAASNQAVALGAAMFGALAAGSGQGGFDELPDAVSAMARAPTARHEPDREAHRVYEELYGLYRHCHDHFGRQHAGIMRRLKEIRAGN